LYSLCMQNLKIPEGAKEEDIWERVIIPLIRMKYINIKGNMNSNIKKIYESMTVVLHNSFVDNSFLLTNLLLTLLIILTQAIQSMFPDELVEGIEEYMNSNTLHVVMSS
jgi:hypothetical protein